MNINKTLEQANLNYDKENYVLHKKYLEVALRAIGDSLGIDLLGVHPQVCLKKNNYWLNLPDLNLVYLDTYYRYHLLYGSLSDAYAIRKSIISAELSLKQQNKSFDSIRFCKSLLETIRFYEVFDLISYTPAILSPHMLEFTAIAYNYAGEHEKAACLRKNFLRSGDDNVFAELISGKEISIFGPLFDIKSITSKPSTNDFIITVNGLSTSSYPFKVNASYYNIRHRENDIDDILLLTQNVDCVSFFWELGSQIIKSKIYNRNCLVRTMRNPCNIVNNPYVPNMLQNILYDLVWHNARLIKIYGFNGYCSAKYYQPGYDDSGLAWAPFGMRCHEPFSNFAIVKNLINANMVVTDRIGDIFKLSSCNYAQKLDLLYRSHTLDSWSHDPQS